MKDKRVLIVDFDDTLVFTMDVHLNSWKSAINDVFNLNLSKTTLMKDIQFGINYVFEKYNLDSSLISKAYNVKRQLFLQNIHLTKINNLVYFLCRSDFFDKVIIATNASKFTLEKIFEYHNLDYSYFDFICTKDLVSHKKPHIEMGNLILNQFREYSIDQFLMIGDSEVDEIFANRLGIQCILLNKS